jgi:hypothetical protein
VVLNFSDSQVKGYEVLFIDAVELKLVGRVPTTSRPSYLSVIRSVAPPRDFKYGRL